MGWNSSQQGDNSTSLDLHINPCIKICPRLGHCLILIWPLSSISSRRDSIAEAGQHPVSVPSLLSCKLATIFQLNCLMLHQSTAELHSPPPPPFHAGPSQTAFSQRFSQQEIQVLRVLGARCLEGEVLIPLPIFCWQGACPPPPPLRLKCHSPVLLLLLGPPSCLPCHTYFLAASSPHLHWRARTEPKNSPLHLWIALVQEG